ncbi:hypothetical protein CYMTET_13297, partial [Cymbomonas tetramitiformis]
HCSRPFVLERITAAVRLFEGRITAAVCLSKSALLHTAHHTARGGDDLRGRAKRKRGASIFCALQDGKMPVHYAIEMGYTDLINELLGSGAAKEEGVPLTPLEKTVQLGDVEAALVLLNATMESPVKLEDGYTAMHHAASKYENTPLILATMLGHTEVAKALLAAGASMEINNQGKWSPLHLCTKEGNLEVTKLLIDAGVKLEEAGGTVGAESLRTLPYFLFSL